MNELQKLINKLKKLKQYKNLSEDELIRIAEEKLFSPEWVGLEQSEIKEAKKRFSIYKERYNIDSYSDLVLLGELIYIEVLINRYKRLIKKISDTTGSPPDAGTIRTLGELEDRALTLRDKLGLIQKEKKDEFIKFLEKAKRYWRERAIDTNVLRCPYCGELIHLVPNMEYWETHKFPFIKSRILYNEHLINLYKSGKITIEDVAKVLETSVEYVKWVIKKFEENKEEADENTGNS